MGSRSLLTISAPEGRQRLPHPVCRPFRGCEFERRIRSHGSRRGLVSAAAPRLPRSSHLKLALMGQRPGVRMRHHRYSASKPSRAKLPGVGLRLTSPPPPRAAHHAPSGLANCAVWIPHPGRWPGLCQLAPLGLKNVVCTSVRGLATHRRIAPTYFTNHWDRTLGVRSA